MRSGFRRRYYRDASSTLAFLGAAAATAAYHWPALAGFTLALAPFASAIVALKARHIAGLG